MVRLLLLVSAIGLNGCKGTIGPFENKRRPGPDPLLPIEEQKRYGAERYAIPEDDVRVSPSGLFNRATPSGR